MSRWDIAFVSTGDDGEDAKISARYNRQAANEAEGLCPNVGHVPTDGSEPTPCGSLRRVDARNVTCDVCGFFGFGSYQLPGESQ